ncbi:uncharacterized protein LOC118270740 [Spodoptera frugiperda]|uniref:Uncharacterized protein LOC118270740 n=1 Tax=Spodoptera frugiperda TaxID=7108 RepID=A0A9R0EKX1_SPOFR|nr:uncharacterized protein LOC118270740 [Spodoptera frugiperda]
MTKYCLLLVSIFLLFGLVLTNSKKDSKDETSAKPHHTKTHSNSANKSADDVEEIADESWNYENTTTVDTRRILFSKRTEKGKRPYMVYLQLTKESAKAHKYRGWLCGGVIVDPYYVLTSAACVEDADRFYIVSGTTKFVDSFDYKNDECVCKHRRKVVWKCIPKNYKFDFQDSIKWSSNDIAIVKVDKAFKFGVQEKGCEFSTELIMYNNISREMEKPGTKGWIAGWGSGNNFREGVYRRQKDHVPKNSKCLQEAKVCIMDNEQCAKKWAQRFREIITQYMICTKDVMKRLSELCDKRYANCTDVETRRQDLEIPSKSLNVDLGRHLRDPDDYTARRSSMQGGFCENDHGGPLIVRYQGKERVIGVISACKIDPKSHSCHGPFLYTSIYRNRQFISCAIHKDVEENCRRVFRSGITHEEWSVSWDNADDDDVSSNDSPVNRNAKSPSVADEKSSDDSDSNDENVLRQLKEDTKTPPNTEKPKTENVSPKEESNSEAEAEEAKATTEKAVQKEGKKPDNKEKTEKHKKKSKSKKHKAKEEVPEVKVETSSLKPVSADERGSSGEIQVRSLKKDPASYESSPDENVNDPDNE